MPLAKPMIKISKTSFFTYALSLCRKTIKRVVKHLNIKLEAT